MVIAFFVKLFRVIGKMLLFVMIRLFLWLPTVFVLSYLIICAYLGIPFGSEPGRTILIAGSVILVAIAFTMAAVLTARKTSRTKEKPTEDSTAARRTHFGGPRIKEVRYYEDEEEYESGQHARYTKRNKKQPSRPECDSYCPKDCAHRRCAKDSSCTPTEVSQPPVQTQAVSAIPIEEKIVSVSAIAQQTANTAFQPKDYPYQIAQSQPLKHTALSSSSAFEKPLVFATRKDPNIIIMEYSDRLLFFEKSKDGGEPVFLAEEFK